ncbi:MAG: hypothetical protein KF833_18220 [Verrucomicrobiae bacterium]|nr:hypothetical protein [Verrucomicrobiae bacterium]
MSAHLPEHRARDTAILRLMGWFFILFAVLVLIGLFWTHETPGRVVNLLASVALSGAGAIFLWTGHRLRRRS